MVSWNTPIRPELSRISFRISWLLSEWEVYPTNPTSITNSFKFDRMASKFWVLPHSSVRARYQGITNQYFHTWEGFSGDANTSFASGFSVGYGFSRPIFWWARVSLIWLKSRTSKYLIQPQIKRFQKDPCGQVPPNYKFSRNVSVGPREVFQFLLNIWEVFLDP